jgi:hypothetical protein
VIAALLGVVGGVVVGWRASGRMAAPAADARPVALFVLGVALGATCGLLVRTQGWLGGAPRAGVSASTEEHPRADDSRAGGLYGLPVAECARLRAAWQRGERELFVREFANSSIPRAKEIMARAGSDPETLILIVEVACTGRR